MGGEVCLKSKKNIAGCCQPTFDSKKFVDIALFSQNEDLQTLF